MREPCADCVRKHFGSGVSAINEIIFGYDDFGTYVSGELDQASQECMKLDVQLAGEIRDYRIKVLHILDRMVAGAIDVSTAIRELPEHDGIREKIKMHCIQAVLDNPEESGSERMFATLPETGRYGTGEADVVEAGVDPRIGVTPDHMTKHQEDQSAT